MIERQRETVPRQDKRSSGRRDSLEKIKLIQVRVVVEGNVGPGEYSGYECRVG